MKLLLAAALLVAPAHAAVGTASMVSTCEGVTVSLTNNSSRDAEFTVTGSAGYVEDVHLGAGLGTVKLKVRLPGAEKIVVTEKHSGSPLLRGRWNADDCPTGVVIPSPAAPTTPAPPAAAPAASAVALAPASSTPSPAEDDDGAPDRTTAAGVVAGAVAVLVVAGVLFLLVRRSRRP
ncbi:hypothetical protein [Actinoplanes sp. URMC 104]|uniref:hypothetical protein n=1 Tax=Actinoplanes sp. URMC 104 TaxID=3423409 RepID=UPI003F1B8206